MVLESDQEEKPAFKTISPMRLRGPQLKELYFHLYMKQIYAGSTKNDVTLVNPNLPNRFGVFYIQDWELLDGRGPGAKVVARAQGIGGQCGLSERWLVSLNIVFTDDRLKGSELQVQGSWPPHVPINPWEWAIVGGTGEFTLAHGNIYGKRIGADNTPTSQTFDVFIHKYYCTMQKPNLPWST